MFILSKLRLGVFALLALLLCGYPALAQNNGATATSAQAATAIQNAILALSARTSVTDVALTGTSEWIAGGDDETGTVSYKALRSSNRLDLSLSGGIRTEIRASKSGAAAGVRVGPDGASHAIAYHNLMADPGWFPLLTLQNISSSSASLLTYVGLETRNGMSVIHLSASQQFPAATFGAIATTMQHLTQVDFYLDPATFLPVAYAYSTHPDDNELADIPVEIRYSNYQSIGGAQIPLHVQRFVNNVLAIDLQFQSAVLNSGLSESTFGLS